VSLLSRVIDAGHEYRNPLFQVEARLFVGTPPRGAKLTRFWMLLVLASLVAAGGVVDDSTPVVIGAMIVSPLATPIYGVALSTVTGSRRNLRDALLLLAAGIAVSILIGMLIGQLTFERLPLDANPQIMGRTAPKVLDLLIAVAMGVAGAFALVRRDVANIVAGVAIAISLVPLLEVVGITLGDGRPDLAWGAFLLFLTNAAAIIVAGVVVFTAAGYQRDAAAAARGAGAGRRATLLITVLVVALVIPLTITSVRTYRYQRWMKATEAAAQQWVADTGWRVTDVHQSGDEIVATVIGPGDPPPLGALQAMVRRSVPDSVTVRIVKDSGETSEF
jgi:uncharacterized hydrophobic protein (TIGR00271 family)